MILVFKFVLAYKKKKDKKKEGVVQVLETIKCWSRLVSSTQEVCSIPRVNQHSDAHLAMKGLILLAVDPLLSGV